ncbi:pitrilysin family protein [Magnetospira sp. QH-2]|uniref:M16 family metallopeptidase n=1 Tax=Magnetospira sp. (strain QH-2) TaxID=1288970 RepID=UPI0003E81902|nr:pitrilysin family protein [Magnetospira sp. QH-2]CCQ74654.1 putative zn-dependent peptidase [Magnetospira sp. QH-2]
MSTVKTTTLPSGLRIVSDYMPSVETVSLGTWVEVGTRHEIPARNGISHLLEHMAFKGTPTRDARAIAEEIEAVGGAINAYTSREHTAYYAKVLKEDAGLAMEILADILQNSELDGEELERERAVVLQEIHQAHDTPDDIVFDYLQETAYPDQPLGRPVLGTADRISALERQDLMDHMSDHYGASSLVVAAAGKIKHEDLEDLAEEAFAGLAGHATAKPQLAAYQGGEHRAERDLEQVNMVLAFDGTPYDHKDYYATSVLSGLLGGGMSSRLFQEIREKHGLVYSIYSFSSSYADGGLFGIYAGTGEEEVAQVVPLICDQIKGVCNNLTDKEVARSKAQIKAAILMSLESSGTRCEQLARQMMIFGRPLPIPEIVERLDAVDTATVRRTAQRIFASTPTLAAVGPLGQLEGLEGIGARLG